MSAPSQVLIRSSTTYGVIALAIAGFAMSYDALHRLAQTSGVPMALAWLWPLVVDGFIVIASVAVVHSTVEGRRAAYPWVLLLGFSTLSVTSDSRRRENSPVTEPGTVQKAPPPTPPPIPGAGPCRAPHPPAT